MNQRRTTVKPDATSEEKIPEGGVRIDKWLWFARFFKTRALATEAVKAGHVELNGSRAKPGKSVKPGDRLEIRKGPYLFTVGVLACGSRRGSADDAKTLYSESEQSRAERAEVAARRREARTFAASPVLIEGRPDKRTRRELQRLRRGTGDGTDTGD